ncbi:hypothetical protein [Rhodopirellula bahusiensis]|uniref:hypothetical protein n=1 Tax=Rhodopirellula bahusiensis TaxID=2014065 RepID=UPI003264FFCF
MCEFAAELAKFELEFAAELAEDVHAVPKDDEIYAYAVEVPADVGNLCIISAIARIGDYQTQYSSIDDLEWWESLLFAFSDRYCDPYWNYSGKSFGRSNAILETMQEQFFTTSDDTTLEERRDLLFEAVLRQMQLSKAEGVLISKWLNLIILSDDEHHVTRQSFNQLNSVRLLARLWPLYNLHWVFYCPIAAFSNLAAKLVGRSRAG